MHTYRAACCTRTSADCMRYHSVHTTAADALTEKYSVPLGFKLADHSSLTETVTSGAPLKPAGQLSN